MNKYSSPISYESARIHAAAIYCSDGRVGEHFDDFLQNGLSLPRYDRLAIPGGPGCIAGHTEAHLEEQGIIDELKFLVDSHELKRVVLIQHQGCAFYGSRLHLPAEYLQAQQKIDLVKAASFVRRVVGITNVDAYLLRIHGASVSFEPVAVV